MTDRTENIQNVILKAMRNANLARGASEQLECTPNAILYGRGSSLDSLGLVNILIDIEDELRDAGMEVSLSDERAMSQSKSPFRSVSALTQYIVSLLETQATDQ